MMLLKALARRREQGEQLDHGDRIVIFLHALMFSMIQCSAACGRNYTASQEFLAFVKNGALSGADGPKRLIQPHL